MSSAEALRIRSGVAERVAAAQAGISRSTWRALAVGAETLAIKSVIAGASACAREVAILTVPQQQHSECSTVAVAYKVLRDEHASWKIHFMELVDEFRRDLDPSLLLLPPPHALPRDLRALLAGIVLELAREAGMMPPGWATKRCVLPKPWFVSGIQSLKASALVESPLAFRRNNIFVNENFLARA